MKKICIIIAILFSLTPFYSEPLLAQEEYNLVTDSRAREMYTTDDSNTVFDNNIITGYLQDILSAIRSSNENKNDELSHFDYQDPEQLPPIYEPTVYDSLPRIRTRPAVSSPTTQQSTSQTAATAPAAQPQQTQTTTAQIQTRTPQAVGQISTTAPQQTQTQQQQAAQTQPAEAQATRQQTTTAANAQPQQATAQTQTQQQQAAQTQPAEAQATRQQTTTAANAQPQQATAQTQTQQQQAAQPQPTAAAAQATRQQTTAAANAQPQQATAQTQTQQQQSAAQNQPTAAETQATRQQTTTAANAQPQQATAQTQTQQQSAQTQPVTAQSQTTRQQTTAAANAQPQQATAQTQTQQSNNSTTSLQATQNKTPNQYAPDLDTLDVYMQDDQQREPAASRTVTVDLGAYLDVIYPGSGWIYLGETDDTNYLQFFGRKLGEADTSFTLRTRNSGRTLLHFYKNDLLTGKYIDDWLEVIVTNKQVANSAIHVTAPSYAAVVPPRPSRGHETDKTAQPQTLQRQESQYAQQYTAESPSAAAVAQDRTAESGGRTVIQTTGAAQREVPQTPTDIQTETEFYQSDANSLLERAKQLYNSSEYEDALDILHQFFDISSSNVDEGLYLQGQILESNSEVRDIRAAIDSYQILMSNWPNSTLWQDAQRRYIYLRRFYINIQ